MRRLSVPSLAVPANDLAIEGLCSGDHATVLAVAGWSFRQAAAITPEGVVVWPGAIVLDAVLIEDQRTAREQALWSWAGDQ